MAAATPNYELGTDPISQHQQQQQHHQQSALTPGDEVNEKAVVSDSESGHDANSLPSARKSKKKGLSGVALIFACGASLFSDGYVNAIAGPVTTLITSYDLYPDATASQVDRFTTLFPSLAFAGTVIGMLSFGFLADAVGRRWGMLICSAGLIVLSILSAGAWGAGGSTGGLFAALIAYRFIIGIFIGGEYPCGSVAAAENTEQENIRKTQQQGLFVLATNSCIDVGFVVASFVVLVLYWIFGMNQLVWVWRMALGLGAIPPLTLLFFRARMQEPDSFRKAATHARLPWWAIAKKYWLPMLAVALVWFAYDYVSYPAGLYASYFTNQLFPDASLSTSLAFSVALNSAYLPGTFIGALLIDRVGPKNMIMTCLILQGIFGFALAGAFGYFRDHTAGLIIMYYIFIALGEAGPGNCLGLLASKAVAPSAIRGRAYGLLAAVGKVGGFVGTYSYTPLQERFPEDSNMHFAAPFYVGSALAIFAALLIILFVPAVVPDGIVKMDDEFLDLLRSTGYDMGNVGLAGDAPEPARISEEGGVSGGASRAPLKHD